jgi:citrate/tricarballylate utilization protein
MRLDEVMREGDRVMTICNACRYCEEYCPVFPAMENRRQFGKGDLTYLANLCHNCGECLYACQYAPPHEFAINVPQTLAKIRVRSYEDYCWPQFLGAAFRQQGLWTSLGLATILTALMFGATTLAGSGGPLPPQHGGDFYAVLPHHVMVSLFSGVSLFVLVALVIGVRRFWRDTDRPNAEATHPGSVMRALFDVMTLRHLHPDSSDCTAALEERTPWRRWFHHCTFYGFLLCFASTSVAALYHTAFGWVAPYGYTSLPVVLGVLGGLGLLVGPAGLLILKRRRDSELAIAAQGGMDVSFIILLFLTSLTGLLLLVLREGAAMGPLLILHLGIVLALFVTLPYGKFVHGIYRTAALIRYAEESALVEQQKIKRKPEKRT